MIDQSQIDLIGILPTVFKKVASTNGGEYAGACPFCGGKDRFRVWIDKGNMWCRQCEFSGDAIHFIQRYLNLDFKGAVEYLRIELPKLDQPKRKEAKRTNPPISPSTLKDDYACFNPLWQRHADNFITDSMLMLGKTPGAMNYLYRRGLSKAVIQTAMLGFNPTPKWITWGDIRYKIPRGVVIPWVYQGQYWRIRFRCLDDNFNAYTPSYKGHEQKYPQVTGSANGIYLSGRSEVVTAKHTVVLVEGEFDALALTANASKLLAHGLKAVATGGSQNAKLLRWVTKLSLARRVYLAFDADQAGANTAFWWQQALPNAIRLRPTLKDITDMVTANHSLYEWLGYTSEAKQLTMFDVETKSKGWMYA